MATSDVLIATLETLKLESDETKYNHHLDDIIKKLDTDESDERTETVTKLVDNGILTELCTKLETGPGNKVKMAQCIAEMAKVEAIRGDCVAASLVPPLLSLMESTTVQATTQACRALGNICFDNDDARSVVDEAHGVQKLLQVMKGYLGRTGEGTNKLRIVLCGFLLNLTNTHECVQEKAISHGALELLEEYLKVHGTDPGTAQMALLTIGSLTDSEAGRDQLSDCEVAITVGNLLGNPNISKDLQENILDLLGTLAESDEVKVQLAQSDVKDHLVVLVRSCIGATDEEAHAIERTASDLLVLLLTGDASMDILYGKGEGLVYKEALEWLTAPSEQLQMCAALAVGNFARNDGQCVNLVAEGITEKLLAMLTRGPDDVHPTLQHAVFSALRNLAIPSANKPKMLDCGLVNVVLQYRSTDITTVQFKLIGLLRMAVDKQAIAATQLGSHDAFVKRLMEWCQVEDHAGVKGEANRLSAWLVKNSQKVDVMRCVVQNGGVPFLINMANAEHTVMQNEALVALALIATGVLDEAVQVFVDGDLVMTIKLILSDTNTVSEILMNVFTLIKGITYSDKLLGLLQKAELPKVIDGLKTHENTDVQHGANTIANILKA